MTVDLPISQFPLPKHNPKRVALISDWFAPRKGGVESQLAGLGRGLGKAGQQIVLITGQPGALGSDFPVIALPTTHLPGIDLVVSPRLIGHMRRALAAFSPDVVHIHASIVAPTCLAGLCAARQLDVPVIVTFHSDMRIMAPLLRLAGRRAWAGVHLSAVSQPIAQQLAHLKPGHEVTILPNGFDSDFWSCEGIPEPPINQLCLVSALRVERKKRPLVLPWLRTEVARRTGCDVQLIIAGRGSRSARLSKEVQATGWLDHISLRALYRRAHLFVMPSTREAFGIAALEARAAGLPIVGRSGTGLATFITDGQDGVLCDSDQAMVDACAGLFQDTGRWQHMAGPRPHLAEFGWGEVISRHIALYNAVSL